MMKIKKLIETAVLASVILLASTASQAAFVIGSVTTTVNGGAFDGTVGDLDFVVDIDGTGAESATTFLNFDFTIFGQTFGVSDDIGTPTINFLNGFVTSVDFSVIDLNPTNILQAGVNDFSFSNGLTLVTNGSKKAYSGTVEVNAVPLPASVWLFVSGLLGLVGLQRRKS